MGRFYKIASFLLLFVANFSFAQEIDMKLAKGYLSDGEYEKAIAYYQELIENPKVQIEVYDDYLSALFYIQNYEEALKMNKKMSKRFPSNQEYEVDKGVILLKQGEKEKAEKHFDKLISGVPNNINYFNQVANRMIKYELLDWAEKTLEYGAKKGNAKMYNYSLANIYVRSNQKEKLQNLLVNGVVEGSINKSYAQNTLQRILVGDDYDKLEDLLVEKVQEHPENYDLNEFMIWIYYQKKDFYGALMQAKAFDRKNKMGGQKVMEVGDISMKNKDYENAIEAYDYINLNYPESQYNLPAKKKGIYAKEEVVKNEFPIDTSKVQSLIDDYNYVLKIYGSNKKNAELYRRIANLQAFYLDKKDESVKILETLIAVPSASRKLVSQAKLDLGDIYILKEEPWEASLLYSQVEKDNKDTPMGFESKLRNARLSYFKGEFELAQAHLDILKLATSREIANDALDLSLLIQDNTGLDTSTEAMSKFANVELLVFQHKMDEAISELDKMLVKYPGHSLTDEIYYQQAQIFITIGDFEKAVKPLQKIDQFYAEDILADDAIMTLAKLYEEKLNKKEIAKELYEDIVLNHSGSIYVDEARKRYRELRGDFKPTEEEIFANPELHSN